MSSERAPSGSGLRPDDLTVMPAATDDELAAILAAYEQLWPEPVVAEAPAPSPRWRFEGRPWVRRTRYGGWC